MNIEFLGIMLSVFVIVIGLGFFLKRGVLVLVGSLILMITFIPVTTVVIGQEVESTDTVSIDGFTEVEIDQEFAATMTAISTNTTQQNWMSQASNTATLSVCGAVGSCAQQAGEQVVSSSSALYNKPFNRMTLAMAKSGTPTGNAAVGSQGASGAIECQIGTKDVATLTGSSTDTAFSSTAACVVAVAPGHIGVAYTGGSVGNVLQIGEHTSDNFDTTNTVREIYFNGAYTTTTRDLRMIVGYVADPSHVQDIYSQTYWQNNVNSEANAYIYADLGTAKELVAVSIEHAAISGVPGEIEVYVSNSTATWGQVDLLIIPELDTANTFYALDDAEVGRYVKFQVSDWGLASRWKVADMGVYNGTSTVIPSSLTTEYTYTPTEFTIEPLVKVLIVVFSVVIGLIGVGKFGLSV